MNATSTMSPKFQIHYLESQIVKLEDEISSAKSHINLVRTIGESNAVNYYPQSHHTPIQHPKYGKISPIYSQYIYYKKYLPEWEAQLNTYYQQLKTVLSSKN